MFFHRFQCWLLLRSSTSFVTLVQVCFFIHAHAIRWSSDHCTRSSYTPFLLLKTAGLCSCRFCFRAWSGLRIGPWGDRNIRIAMLGANGVDSAVSDGGRIALDAMIRLSQIMTRGDWVRLLVLLIFTVGAVTWVLFEWQQPLLPAML